MGTLSKSIEIERPAEDVFRFVNDFDKMNAAHSGYTEAHYTSKGPVGVGSTAHFVGTHGGSNMEWDMRLTDFEENKKVRWHTDKPSKMTNTLLLEPTSKGTILTHIVEYELPYSYLGRIIDKLKVRKDVEKEMDSWLENAKNIIEEKNVEIPA
ncbi:MAG: SRPBCC family protein [Candidatus Bathyarchaeota archaeon]|nr:SRPBCC family protein [Candidatus Bathyarchaeota archaeon]